MIKRLNLLNRAPDLRRAPPLRPRRRLPSLRSLPRPNLPALLARVDPRVYLQKLRGAQSLQIEQRGFLNRDGILRLRLRDLRVYLSDVIFDEPGSLNGTRDLACDLGPYEDLEISIVNLRRLRRELDRFSRWIFRGAGDAHLSGYFANRTLDEVLNILEDPEEMKILFGQENFEAMLPRAMKFRNSLEMIVYELSKICGTLNSQVPDRYPVLRGCTEGLLEKAS